MSSDVLIAGFFATQQFVIGYWLASAVMRYRLGRLRDRCSSSGFGDEAQYALRRAEEEVP